METIINPPTNQKTEAMTHEKNMMDYQDFLQKKNLAMKPGDMLYGKSYCFDKANTHLAFLDSEPKLGDFVPTNEKGEVMEKLSKIASFGKFEFQEAQSRVLWKGWRVKYNGDIDTKLINKDKGWLWISTYKSYDELITSGVKLERIQKK